MKYYTSSPTLQIERTMAEYKWHFSKYLEALRCGTSKDRKYHSQQAKRLDEKLTHLVKQLMKSEA